MLQKSKYKNWNILLSREKGLLDYAQNIIHGKHLNIIKELKNNRRSKVFLVKFQGRKYILKSPREKNRSKWIRLTTLYRRGEAFKILRNLVALKELGIITNLPAMAVEKRVWGMVVDSWVLYHYIKGWPCQKDLYQEVIKTLEKIHSKNILHGDPQINNFLYDGQKIIIIDANPKKSYFGWLTKAYEYLYLAHSAPGVSAHFGLLTKTMSYKIAKIYSELYWKWRSFKKKRRKLNLKNPRILIIRFSSIGDIILTTPVLRAIKEKYPNATLDFLVLDRFKDAIKGNPDIDNLLIFQKEKYKGLSGIFYYYRHLKNKKYDLIIDLHSKIRSIIISNLIKGPVLRYKKRSWWKAVCVKMRLITYHVDDTIVRNYFAPLKKIGIFYSTEKLYFSFTSKDLAKTARFDNFVVMAPGAANNTKKWPKEYFGALGKKLKKDILLIGGKNEFENLEEIKNIIGPRCVNLAGRLSLKESGALLSKANFVITNDSGPFHMARGVRAKTFVIFGPTDPDMFEYSDNAILLFSGVKCSPCSLHGDSTCPKKHFECMRSLTPEKVYQVIIDSEIHKASAATR